MAYRRPDPDHLASCTLHAPLLKMAGAKKKQREAWDRFANGGRAVLVGAATLLPQRAGANRSRISAGTCVLAIKLITELLKKVVPERRPDGEDNKSFPSEHAAESVAAAMIIEREYPGNIGALAYALAATVSMSRIESKKHHPRDVAAGAFIGAASVWVAHRLRLAIERRMHGIR
jgi:membrane-associated phospholipid phosphatase